MVAVGHRLAGLVGRQVYAALEDQAIHKSDHSYFTLEDAQSLQHVIALEAARPPWPRTITPELAGQRVFVATVLGTVGWVQMDSEGRPSGFTPVPLNTFDQVLDCDPLNLRIACIVSTYWTQDRQDNRIAVYDADAGTVQYVDIPDGATPHSVHLFADEGIAFGEYDYSLFARVRPNSDWQVDRAPDVESGMFNAGYLFMRAADGFYTLYDGNDYHLTWTDHETGAITAVELPRRLSFRRSRLLIIDSDLLIGPADTGSWAELYRVDPDGSGRQLELPDKDCSDLSQVVDEEGNASNRIQVTCDDRRYVSDDIGVSWQSG